ncbi:MAG: hypothetical protein HXX10_13490 [Rhodoplanes sp.]|uniref:hypothetical protein n=1 Tax=Rhodoplanes sp. TaxID=1968906 RepID=UPI0017F7A5C0|nr:hypothetical protein [Rhodoplanes sp.]NVO15042.1 hypothetical protein [Rhodoplanes sp.]
MKALLLYTVFVAIGAVLSAVVGYNVERQVSEAAGLIVFLAMFFSNFVVSWIFVILAIDRTLKNAYGRAEQLAIEKDGRTAASGRAAS